MATTFTGLRVQDTYNAIIKIGDNSTLTGTGKLLSDGFGNSSNLYLSTTSLGIGVAPTENLHIAGSMRLTGSFKDKNNESGTTGQVLTSTATGTDWKTISDIDGVTSATGGTANYVPIFTSARNIENSIIQASATLVTISGNLDVNGTVTYIDTIDLSVKDPLIKLANANVSNTLDIGFYGKYVVSATTKYLGLYSDASDSNKFRLFTGLETEPTTVVDSSDTTFAVGTLIANIEGNLTGNVAGNVTGNVTGNLTGNVTGGTISGTTGSFSGLVTGIAPTVDLNFATKKYVDDNIPTITTPALSAVLAVGNTSGTNNLIIQDDDELVLGSSNDFRAYHNQTNTLFRIGTGDLIFNSFVVDGDIKFQLDNGIGTPTEYMRLDGGEQKVIFARSPWLTDNLRLYFGNDTANDSSIYWNSSASQLYIDGPTKITETLNVVGSTSFDSNVILAKTNATSYTNIYADGSGLYIETAGSTDALSDMRLQARASGAGNYVQFFIKPSNQSFIFKNGGATSLTIDSSQNSNFTGSVIAGSATAVSSFGPAEISSGSAAGWGTTNYPYIGSTGGATLSGIFIHNPHIPYRTDNIRSGATGRAGVRMAIDAAGTNWWDSGLIGDEFEIYRNASSERMLVIDSAGNNTALTSSRSPIFYDSLNTAQFINPGGSISRMLGLLKIGNSSTYNTDDGGWGTRLVVASTVHARIDVAQDADSMRSSWFCHTGNTGSLFGTITAHDQWLYSHNAKRQTLFSGYSQEEASYRAPLFYDSNDTTYYGDFASTSNMFQGYFKGKTDGWSLQLGDADITRVQPDNARASLVINASLYPHIYMNATGGVSNLNHGAVFSMTGNITGGFKRWSMGISNWNPNMLTIGTYDNSANPHYGCGGDVLGEATWGSKFWLDSDSNLQTNGSMRSPIFYDSNDTAYYLNPASTSNLNIVTAVQFNGPATSATNLIGPGGSVIKSTTTGVSYQNNYQIRENTGGSGNTNEIYAPQLGFHWGSVVASSIMCEASGRIAIRDNPGTGYEDFIASICNSSESSRAPIFYDSDNTGYYLNPSASGSNALKTIGDWRQTSDSWSGEVGGKMQYHGTNWYIQAGASFIYRNSAGSNKFTVDNGGIGYIADYLTGANSLRAPLFYDSDNGAYYGDFSGTSNINKIQTVGYVVVGGNFSNNPYNSTSGVRLMLGSGSSDAIDHYNIGTDMENVGGNYTKLGIKWHTGIRIGAQPGYGGVRFFTNEDFGTQVMSVNNALDGLGGSHVYVNESLVAGASLRASIFYDNDNTSYFTDPGGTTSARLYGFVKIGNSVDYNTDDGGWGSRLIVASTVHARIDVAQDVNDVRSSWYCHTGQLYSVFGTQTGHDQQLWSHGSVRQYLYNGWSQEAGSYRAPYFYDSNDTTYYGDFAGISTVNQINSTYFGYTVGDPNATYTYNDSSTRSKLYITNAYPVVTLNGNTSNANHGPTLQFTGNGYDSNHQWVIGSSGTSAFLDFGWGTPTNKNPHNGIAGYGGGGGGATVMRMIDSGYVGIGPGWGAYGTGPVNPAYNCHILGNAAATTSIASPIFYDLNNTTYLIDPSTTGTSLNVAGTGIFGGDVVAYSDKKLKTNIKTLDGSKVLKMRGVSFDRIDTGNASSGVIAQEIQEIAPELVNDKNGTLAVAYGNLTGYLIEAIKDQQIMIDDLKKRLKTLENN